MYSMLVVDDSCAERDCVAFLIQTHELPIAVHTACNGSDALELLRRDRFDILFTDVRMPFLDGLALSKAALELVPDQKIIIFSGYHEFEYARTAIGLGVSDYLLKPLDPREFLGVLQRVMDSIGENRRRLTLQEERLGFARRHLLLMMLNSVPAQALAKARGAEISLDFLAEYRRMVLLELHSDFFSGAGAGFEAALREWLDLPFDYLNVSPNQSVVLLKGPGEISEGRMQARMKALGSQVEEEHGQVLYIAFSGNLTPATIGQCYRQLEELLELRFFFPGTRVFSLEMKLTGAVCGSNPISLEIIGDDLRLRDYPRLREHLGYLFARLREAPCYSQLYVKFLFSSVVKDILALLPADRASSLETLVEELYRGDDIRQLERHVLGAVELLESSVPSLTAHASRAEAVKQYIYRNYQRDISLDILAREVYVHPDYLCRIFKQETGVTLNKFIKAHRMEKARELLEGSRMKIREVCEAVGYQNVSYFCQSFREYFGVSPDTLRQRDRREAGAVS